MTKPDLFPSDACLLREEYVSLFYFGYDIGVSLDLLMMNSFAVDDLTHLNEVRRRALEADYCVPWIHVTLKLIELVAALHDSSLRLPRLRVGVLPHMRDGGNTGLSS